MRLGVEVWPVITVHFSNHTGYGAWRGPLLAAADVADVIRGIDERGVLRRGRRRPVRLPGRARRSAPRSSRRSTLVKRRNPAAIYCCDPVMGDVGRGFFVRPGIPEFMRDQVVPAAADRDPQPLRAGLPDRTPDDARSPRCWRPPTPCGRWDPTSCWSPAPSSTAPIRGPSTMLAVVARRGLAGDHPAAGPDVHRLGRPHHGRSSWPSTWLRTGLAGGAVGRTADVVYSVLEARPTRLVRAAAGRRSGRDRAPSTTSRCAAPCTITSRWPRTVTVRSTARSGQSWNTSMLAPSAFSRFGRSS